MDHRLSHQGTPKIYRGTVRLFSFTANTFSVPLRSIAYIRDIKGFPGDSDCKESACNARGEGNGNRLQYSCLENPMDGGAWRAAVHGVTKSWTWLSDFTFTFHFHALEKAMATHSSVLAWRIPGTAEPGGLPSMGSHRAGHDWSDLAAAAAMPETQVRFLGREGHLEEEMATHSSILAWRIPLTEETGRPWSIRSQRVGHDWSDLAQCTGTLRHFLSKI